MLYNLKNIVEETDFKRRSRELINEGCWVELKKKAKNRTIKTNAYLHVCISLFAIEFGYTLDEAKTLLKRMCPFMIYEKNDQKFLKRTRDLNTEDCSTFVNWIRNYSSQNGYYILSADEYKTNSYAIDKEINKHKEFL
ncbi:hypothetical protein Harreka1_34 [Olleya phage Harreka_1]|uniref:Uncharacterized protein n=1 Tax=Olleya phage Harreka_1 TaxID=2745673 RepID=A0A8E4ZCB3_9CAUD|nr:hypothetical protein M1M26_gp34 [Olleya phage Harreka_1]QQV90441.1 hypothetical protein Harreka1_34 [Olleya phage Harreka_1]